MALVPYAGGFESVARTALSQVSPYLIAQEDKKKNGQDDPAHIADYITTNRFYVEIETDLVASFSECSSLGFKTEPTIFLEGGLNNHQRVLLNQTKFENITLKRGLSSQPEFLNWVFATLIKPDFKGNPPRRNINILQFNQAGEIIIMWTLIGAIPISWKGPGLIAKGAEVGIEELILAFEGISVIRKEKDKPIEGSPGPTIGDNMRRDDELYCFPTSKV